MANSSLKRRLLDLRNFAASASYAACAAYAAYAAYAARINCIHDAPII